MSSLRAENRSPSTKPSQQGQKNGCISKTFHLPKHALSSLKNRDLKLPQTMAGSSIFLTSLLSSIQFIQPKSPAVFPQFSTFLAQKPAEIQLAAFQNKQGNKSSFWSSYLLDYSGRFNALFLNLLIFGTFSVF